MSFALHPQLAQDTIVCGQFPLCRVLLMNDAQYPWFILVPAQEGLREILELSAADRKQLWQESDALSRWLMQVFQPDKLNIAALGNMVPQLHLHHIARFRSDVAWPRPVWGQAPAVAYTPNQVQEIRTKLGSLQSGFASL